MKTRKLALVLVLALSGCASIPEGSRDVPQISARTPEYARMGRALDQYRGDFGSSVLRDAVVVAPPDAAMPPSDLRLREAYREDELDSALYFSNYYRNQILREVFQGYLNYLYYQPQYNPVLERAQLNSLIEGLRLRR